MRAPEHAWIRPLPGPIYLLEFPRQASDAEVEAFADARERWAEGCAHRHAWIVDARRVREATARQRQILAQHLKRFEPLDTTWNVGTGFVVDNPLVRGFLTAVFWLSQPKFHHAEFGELEEAQAWCRARLEAP